MVALEQILRTSEEPPRLSRLAKLAAAWAWSNGLVLYKDPAKLGEARLAPISLLPFPIPRRCFQLAYDIAPIFSSMMAKITWHPDWLFGILKGSEDAEFTARLIQVAQSSYGDPTNLRDITKDIVLVLTRSDYLIEKNGDRSESLRQVEINAISLSYAALPKTLRDYHRIALTAASGDGNNETLADLPDNKAFPGIIKTLKTADCLFKRKYGKSRTCILVVVAPLEINEFDQRMIENALAMPSETGPGVPVFRFTFDELADLRSRGQLSIDSEIDIGSKNPNTASLAAGQLILDQDEIIGKVSYTVSIVYYRTGYSPGDYGHDDKAWKMRTFLEISDAVKVPNIYTHLAGVKKVQAAWNEPQNLHFCCDGNALSMEAVRQTFMDQLVVEVDTAPESHPLLKEAVDCPDKFILKPLREGGANNIVGEDMVKMLLNKFRPAPYVLMRRIEAVPQKCFLLATDGTTQIGAAVSELGVFGALLGDGKKIYRNEVLGHLLRTKLERSVEGGVTIGAGYLDSPILIEHYES